MTEEERRQEIAALRDRLQRLEATEPKSVSRPDDSGPLFQPTSQTVSKRKPNRIGWWIGGGIAAILVLSWLNSTGTTETVDEPANLAQISDADLARAADAAAAAATAAADAGSMTDATATRSPSATNWFYTEDRDPMRDRSTHLACTTSTNEVMLTWPYRPTQAQLCIRQSPRFGRDVYFSLLGDGQIPCRSYDGCTVRARFDSGPVQSLGANGPSDGSTETIFINGAERFTNRLKESDRTILEIEFYRAGVQQIEFNTAGLVWPPNSAARASPPAT